MAEILERGDIFFLYRPKLNVESVHSLEDMQRFYMVVKPERKQVFRRIIVGRKRLPDPGEHERTWGFVDLVSRKPEEIEDEFDPQQYETRTRGVRFEPPARPVGEAVFAIVCHEGHTHIAYALELPKMPGEAQRGLNIKQGDSLIVTVKNPDASSPSQAGLPPWRKPDYPEALKRNSTAGDSWILILLSFSIIPERNSCWWAHARISETNSESIFVPSTKT